MENLIKRGSLIAPILFIILLAPSSLIGWLLICFPYAVVFLLTHFIKHENKGLLIANAILLAFLVLSSASAIFGMGSDPQSAVGVFIITLVQALVSALFASVYFVIGAFKGYAHNKALK